MFWIHVFDALINVHTMSKSFHFGKGKEDVEKVMEFESILGIELHTYHFDMLQSF
jgi:hypothetical protein